MHKSNPDEFYRVTKQTIEIQINQNEKIKLNDRLRNQTFSPKSTIYRFMCDRAKIQSDRLGSRELTRERSEPSAHRSERLRVATKKKEASERKSDRSIKKTTVRGEREESRERHGLNKPNGSGAAVGSF